MKDAHYVVDFQKSHDRLSNTVNGIITRIDRYELSQTIRNSQFNRLLE